MPKSIKYIIRQIKYIINEIPLIVNADSIIARYRDIPAKENRVNIFEYHPDKKGFDLVQNSPYNLGDSLGEVIIRFLLAQRGLEIDGPVNATKHLYCVGTNIHGGWQSATIWGSGIYPPQTSAKAFLMKLCRRRLDVRAVRGPLTKQILERYGYKCPDVFGDPAVLMPMIYNPPKEVKYEYLIIPQFIKEREFRDSHPGEERIISMNTNDYKTVIDEIVSSRIVYTSSLHGIILAEAYGVPAVFYRGLPKYKDFKYLDYYYSTGRKDIKIAESIEEAMTMTPLPLPDLSEMRKNLLDSFPYDLWEN